MERTRYSSWKFYREHQNYNLLHPSMKSALRILALLFWVGGCERLTRWFGVHFPPCSNGQFLDLGVWQRGQKLFGQCPNRRATFHKGASSVWLKTERKVPLHHYQLSIEYQTILFLLFNILTGLMSSQTQRMCLKYQNCNNWLNLGHNSNYYQFNLYFIFE